MATTTTNTQSDFCVGRGMTSPDIERPDVQPDVCNIKQSVHKWLFSRFIILRSSAFRLGVLFWLLFTTCFGVTGYLFYETLQDRVLNRIDDSITERFEQVEQQYELDGIEAVVKQAEQRSETPMESSMGFHLSSVDGDRIAGNVYAGLIAPGWDDVVGKELGLVDDASVYRFYTADLDGNVLSLGKSLDDLVELRKIALNCLLWTAIVSTLVAFVAAWFFASRTHKRVMGISDALDVVATGDLTARLPIGYADDDIDQLSMKINSSFERLGQTVDGMRQVSTDIAHDLKTPLNRLYISIEEAADKSRAGACVGDDLEVALEEAQSISGTFDALLRIAQIEAGARKSQFTHLDLTDAVETAAEVYSPVVEEHGHNLIVDLQDKSLPMLGDRRLLLQLIVNLIENAVHHCPVGTDIVLSCGEAEEGVWFSVADSGPGIPETKRQKVFQRLYRLERSRTTKGTGLGLSLVKAIADLHCGRVKLADNKPGLLVKVNFDRNCPLDK